MRTELTGQETADELIKQLVYLRLCARRILRRKEQWSQSRAETTRLLNSTVDDDVRQVLSVHLAEIDEWLLESRFMIIEVGKYLMPLCAALDEKASREQIYDALGVGLADRDSEGMRKYGNKALHIISVLDLENSATRNDDTATRPLKWCHTMAFMHALQTSEKLGRIVHDGANEFFGGVFGEYQERPLTERLAGRSL